MRRELAGHAHCPTPAMRYPDPLEGREQVDHQLLAKLELRVGQGKFAARPGAEPVAAPGTEYKTAVRRSLAVGNQPAAIAESRARRQSDFIPLGAGQWFCGDRKSTRLNSSH